jgi:hypothetical protein
MKRMISKGHKRKAKVKLITPKNIQEIASLRDALMKLVQIDAQGGFEEIHELKEIIIDLFFEGRFYICYDPTTGHLAFAPTLKSMAKMQSFYV